MPTAAVGDAATDPAGLLAAAYRRGVLHLAARDLTGVITIDEAAAELADLADAVLDSALAVARAELPAEHPAEAAAAATARLAIVAMGKCGARELNYASDVDVIFVAEPPELPGRESAEPGRRADLGGGRARRRHPAGGRARSGSASAPPPRAPSSRSTRTCAPRAARARSSAPSPATSPTTTGGRRRGSSRRC